MRTLSRAASNLKNLGHAWIAYNKSKVNFNFFLSVFRTKRKHRYDLLAYYSGSNCPVFIKCTRKAIPVLFEFLYRLNRFYIILLIFWI